MLRRFLIVAVSCLCVILAPAASFAFRGGGGHVGGGHFGGGHFGGGHFGGFGGHFGGMRGFGGAHFGGHFARGHFTGRSHFARGGRFHGRGNRFAHGNRTHRLAQNRAAAHRFARNARANRLANNARTRFANAGRHGLANNARFGRRNGFANARWGGHGWRNHGFRRFWAGGVFWPYFWGDYFSYAFWPYDYYDPFWGWGPDALLWSAFWPYYDYPYFDYGFYNIGYAGAPYAGDIYRGYRHSSALASQQPQRAAAISPQEAASTCAGFAPGVDGLPFQRIEAIIQPTPDQALTLGELKQAMAQASNILSGACPAQTPLTPTGRLDAMEQRLQAMQQAEDVVRSPLEKLYGQLTPQQRQRLDASVAGGERSAKGQHVDLAKLCSTQAGFANVPADDIERTIKLDSQQMQDLNQLKQASAKAADILRESCPANVPNTLDARLDAAQKRISALIQAIDTIRPEVKTFFASLSNAQRTALNSQAPNIRTASNRRR